MPCRPQPTQRPLLSMDPFQVWPLSMATHTKSIAGGHWWAIENPITAHDLKSVYIRRWGHQSVDPSCQLCGRPASLRHILNACPSALNQGHYTWRHDSVLRILKCHLLSFWQSPLTQSAIKDQANLSTQPYIRFVPAGSASTQSTRHSTHLHSNNHHMQTPSSVFFKGSVAQLQ